MSPPHGNILSNTSYSQDFLDKPFSRRELIIRPGNKILDKNIKKAISFYDLLLSLLNFFLQNQLKISEN
jgi:hypothetical protein